METIKLDLIPGKKMPSLHASQYDDGREHGIDLFENGVAYKLDGTETLTINERKGDDCICSLDIVNTFAETNHIVFSSTEQMCAVWGNNICELVIAKGEKTIGTLNFILEIEQSPTENGVESESEIKNLERQIEAITEEVIGDDYYTAEQTDEAIATAIEGKADKSDTYTKTQVDNALNNKMDMTNPTGSGAVSIGRKAETTIGADSFSVGWNTEASSSNAFASGQETVASGANSNAEGYKTLASGYGAHAENRQTTASGGYSHAEGWSAVSSGSSSHAEGYSSESSGTSAHAEGYQTIASNDSSHAEGYQTTASGKQSHAEGYQTTASGNQSHAEGYKTTANAYSHSEGVQTNASGTYSHAEGYRSEASGDAAHAEGWSTNASGLCAHAEGRGTTASGTYSSAIGYQTIANHKSQHAFGEFNVEDSSTFASQSRGNYIEIVGNGTGANNRSNARTLDWSGNETLMGDLTYNGNKSLTSEISRLDGRIDNLPSPMIFKGTLGVGGTIQTLPAASASNEGWTYKVITDGTYAGQTAKVGDVFTSNGSAWVLIPSGDEDNDTWRAIKVNGVEKLGNGTSSGAVDFVGSENIEVDFDGNGNKVGVKTKNIYTKEEVDDIVYNILPDDTASGSVANFETDLALPIKSLEIDVNAKQDLHGYDYPWTAGSGKNKIDTSANGISALSGGSYVSAGITYTANGDYTIKVNGTSTGAAVLYVLVDIPTTKFTNKTFTLSATGNFSSITGEAYFQATVKNIVSGEITSRRRCTPTNNTVTFTVSENEYIGDMFVRLSSGAQASNATIKLQLEEGSAFTSWTPYENICPISGRSEISVVHCGKNLFDKTNSSAILEAYLNAGVVSYNPTCRAVFVECKPNTTYTISKTAGKRFSVAYTTEIPDIGVSYYGNIGNNTGSEITITTGANAKYLISFVFNGVYDTITAEQMLASVQIEANTSATSFEPFNGTTEVINLGGTYYGGHFTQDKDGHRQFVVTHSIIVLSSDNMSIIGRVNANKYRVFNSNCGAKITGIDYADILCDKLKPQTGTTNDGRCYINASGDIRMNFAKEYSSVADMIADIESVSLVYPLETPYVIDLPDGEPIITLNGTNNIYADTGDASVVFKNSVNGYVEKKIANVQALVLNT